MLIWKKYFNNSISRFTIVLILLSLNLSACIIQNPRPEECKVATVKIVQISEGTSFDILFNDSQGDQFYINRGLQLGLNLDSLNAKVLNKTVTLHLPKFWHGNSVHIAQLQVDKDTVYTEFN